MIKSLGRYLKAKNVVLFLFGVIILFGLVQFVGAQQVWSSLVSMDIRFLVLVVALKILSFFVWNFKWKIIVDEISKVRYSKLFPIYLAGLFVNNITPAPTAGGEPLKAFYLAKLTKEKASKCLATAVMDTVVQIAVLLGFVFFSIFYVLLFVNVPKIKFLLGVFLFCLIAGIIATAYIVKKRKSEKFRAKADSFFRKIYHIRFLKFLHTRFGEYENFKKYVIKHFYIFGNTMGQLWGNKKMLLKVVFVALVFQIIWYLKTWFIFIGLGQEIPILNLLIVLTVAGMLGYFVFVPGGTGIVEAVMVALFVALGVDIGVATAATLIDRVLFYLLTYGFGYGSLNYLNLKYSK